MDLFTSYRHLRDGRNYLACDDLISLTQLFLLLLLERSLSSPSEPKDKQEAVGYWTAVLQRGNTSAQLLRAAKSPDYEDSSLLIHLVRNTWCVPMRCSSQMHLPRLFQMKSVPFVRLIHSLRMF
jgi:hypothetical protein